LPLEKYQGKNCSNIHGLYLKIALFTDLYFSDIPTCSERLVLYSYFHCWSFVAHLYRAQVKVNTWHSSSVSGPFLVRFSALRQGILCCIFGPAYSKRRRSFSPARWTYI